MALLLEYEDNTGTIHPEAYARISKTIIENPVGGSKNVSVDVCIYASQKARNGGKSPVWGPQGYVVQNPTKEQPVAKEGDPASTVVMECAVDLDKMAMVDVYAWLKTQDTFKEAIDI